MVVWARAWAALVGQTTTTAAGTAPPSWVPTWISDVLAATPGPVVQLLQSLVVIALAYGISQLLVQLLGRRIARHFRRPSLTRTALRGIRAIVFVFAILTIMGIYGYGLSDLTLSVAVFSAVVGVILAPIVGSIISGVFLLADQPYEIGDMIELADRQERGFVEDITLRYTKIFTLDNTFLVIPNGSMRDRDVVNYSAEDTRTRQALDILITYESDLERARNIVEQAARDVDGVVSGGPRIRVGAARYPAGPTCYIDEFGDHGINLRLRYWIEEPYWLLRTRSRIQTAFAQAIVDEDVEIAYPHQHHVFDQHSGEMQVSLDGATRGSSRGVTTSAERRAGEQAGSDLPEGTTPAGARPDDTNERGHQPGEPPSDEDSTDET